VIRQLAFDLPLAAAMGRADFIVSDANAEGLRSMDGWRDWPRGRMLLIGPPGAGKTHLARIWAQDRGASVVTVADLLSRNPPQIAAPNAVAVEDCDSLGALPEAQTGLFHLYNLLDQQGGTLLLTARTPPRDWGLALPDLSSRMQSVAQTRLAAPDDVLLSAVLIKLFADRQVPVPPTLIPYLLPRMERSFSAARTLVAALDSEALARRCPVTRSLAASLLDKDQTDSA